MTDHDLIAEFRSVIRDQNVLIRELRAELYELKRRSGTPIHAPDKLSIPLNWCQKCQRYSWACHHNFCFGGLPDCRCRISFTILTGGQFHVPN